MKSDLQRKCYQLIVNQLHFDGYYLPAKMLRKDVDLIQTVEPSNELQCLIFSTYFHAKLLPDVGIYNCLEPSSDVSLTTLQDVGAFGTPQNFLTDLVPVETEYVNSIYQNPHQPTPSPICIDDPAINSQFVPILPSNTQQVGKVGIKVVQLKKKFNLEKDNDETTKSYTLNFSSTNVFSTLKENVDDKEAQVKDCTVVKTADANDVQNEAHNITVNDGDCEEQNKRVTGNDMQNETDVSDREIKLLHKDKIEIMQRKWRKSKKTLNKTHIKNILNTPCRTFYKECNYCNTMQPDIMKHIYAEHGSLTEDGGIKCNICQVVTMRILGTFNEHLKLHSDYKHFKCSACGAEFKKAIQLETHIESKHQSKVYQCSICSKDFTAKAYLRAHVTLHSRSHLCNVCGKTFNTKRNLVNHERVHDGKKPFACDICGVCTQTASHLQRHKKLHFAPNNKFYCGLCEHSTIQKYNMNVHMKIHLGELCRTLFHCEKCRKSFPTEDLLEEHTGSCPNS